MATAVIVQARVGSTRFPNKMTLPFYAKAGMLHYLLRRMVNANLPAPIILAIPDSSENDILGKIGSELGLKIFRGSEDDVLQRFIAAATHYNASRIIRVCADNPFLDIHSITTLIETLESDDTDYISFCLANGTPTIKTHYGFWAEAVKLSALKSVAKETNEKLFCEHVTNYIYSHPEKYTRRCLTLDPIIEANPWARFTVDTQTDFETMSHLATHLPPHTEITPAELIKTVAAKPEIKNSMEQEIRKNQK